ncbi:hypothetical protein F511_40602 [Dorcoceras hygrometricum]|uniref:Uncharacterized protein n=1 Tax=Dorcoceras hygrometricum TaxID=472368 RepID=A0A2Z7CX04_9LAMI|nr:hypothetical protein F511_40602 [Dorcoceras hygrometricum]
MINKVIGQKPGSIGLLIMLRNDSPVVTPSDIDEEEETIDVGAAGGDQQVQFSTEGTTDDELLSIEEHQARIPFNASLPSTLAPTITPIRFGQGIEFREVDAYKASLPQIDASDKGKGILVEDDVQGHPAREIFSLICADIEFLIALREKVIEDVSIFVSSFSLRKFSTLQSEDIFSKEGQVLSWAEIDSSFVAIQRRRFIIAKYRELLLRKFIEARRKNFVSRTPTSAIDLKVLKLLGAAHLFALKDLLRHMREHLLEWTRPSSSSLLEGPVIDRGFFCCFLFASTPACTTADLSSSAELDVVTNDIIIDGPLRCSSWFPFDVPTGPSSSSRACSWFTSFQLIHYAPTGSTWPPPDYEQLILNLDVSILIQLPIP